MNDNRELVRPAVNGFGVKGGGFWIAGVLGAMLLSGCGSRPEGNVLDRDMGQRNPTENSTSVPGEVNSPVVGDVTTSGGGTNVVFPFNSQPTHQDPEPGSDLGPIYGERYYLTYGQDEDPRINVAPESGEPHASAAAADGENGK